jgi:hypothetical protein
MSEHILVDPEDSLEELLTKTFDRVYFASERRTRGEYKLTKLNTPNRIVQFFGLPSGASTKGTKILKYLTGWNENYSTSRNLLQALFIFPINFVLAASKTALNIVKLATEVLPRFIAGASFLACAALCELAASDQVHPALRVLSVLGLVFVAAPSAVASHIAYFIGGAVTSPAENARGAFAAGRILFGNSWAGNLTGGIFALVSIAVTACVYAILFPLAIKALIIQAPSVLPAIANGISQFVGIFSAQAGASVSTFFMTTLPTFFSGISAAFSSGFSLALSAFTVSAPEAVAGLVVISASVAAGVTALTAAVDRVGEGIAVPDGNDSGHLDGPAKGLVKVPALAGMGHGFRALFAGKTTRYQVFKDSDEEDRFDFHWK